MDVYRADVRFYGKGRRLMNICRPHYSFHPIKPGSCFDAEGRGTERDGSADRYAVVVMPGGSKVVEGTSGMVVAVPIGDGVPVKIGADSVVEHASAWRFGLSLIGRE